MVSIENIKVILENMISLYQKSITLTEDFDEYILSRENAEELY